MSKINMLNNQRGFAIVLVLVFCISTLAMASAMFFFRKESKQQGKSNIHFIQANFLAQSAIQHMLAKLSAFPQEACDAGVLALGHCPFQGILSEDTSVKAFANTEGEKALEEFCSDCSTEVGALPWKITATGFNKGDWKYHIDEFKVISAYTIKAEHKLILTVRITAIGEANELKGQMGWRKEKMIKTVELTRLNL